MVIFEKSQAGRYAFSQVPDDTDDTLLIDPKLLRMDAPLLPELSELEVVRHYTQLSQRNYCIETNFYPLGSCTMKYNPKGVQSLAMLAAFSNHHPLSVVEQSQGVLSCLYELQEYLKVITGMQAVSLTPMAGAQGEFAGCAMIRAFHRDRKDFDRNEMLVSDSAHGTNPASAKMCGFVIKEVPTTREGNINLKILKTLLSNKTAGMMLTNPSTLGLFDSNVQEASDLIHQAGGLLYYDGANMNAILGKVRPSDMGFDVMHLNMHKTFATPHGGGGPGSGPVAVNELLQPYLPVPMVIARQVEGKTEYDWITERDCPKSMGRLSTFMGNVGILLRAYIYIRLLGPEGLRRVAEFATLNANYLMVKLQSLGFDIAFPTRRASHEFIVTIAKQVKASGVNAMDVAKSLLDRGIYAPTTYFPLLIPETLLIEPTETESKQTLDEMVLAMKDILQEIKSNPQKVKSSPSRLTCKRLDETKAARELELVWKKKNPQKNDPCR